MNWENVPYDVCSIRRSIAETAKRRLKSRQQIFVLTSPDGSLWIQFDYFASLCFTLYHFDHFMNRQWSKMPSRVQREIGFVLTWKRKLRHIHVGEKHLHVSSRDSRRLKEKMGWGYRSTEKLIRKYTSRVVWQCENRWIIDNAITSPTRDREFKSVLNLPILNQLENTY